MVKTLLFLLLGLLGPLPTRVRACLEARQALLLNTLVDIEVHWGVPAPLLVAIGFVESHWGCSNSGSWGTLPHNPEYRRRPSSAVVAAAQALQTAFQRCGGRHWEPALHRFLCGRCEGCRPRRGRYRPSYVRALTAQVYAAAEVPLPESLIRAPPPGAWPSRRAQVRHRSSPGRPRSRAPRPGTGSPRGFPPGPRGD